MFICISGSSGVGKTTFSKLLASFFRANDVVMMCGDDAHKWERNDPAWKTITHFNPAANNLVEYHTKILNLLEGKSVINRHYNHTTGQFDDPLLIIPQKHIIYEGLHSLYDEFLIQFADIKIYVDTEEILKNEWKLKRDTKKRNYNAADVNDMIARRQIDESAYLLPQKKNADIIIKFFKNFQLIEMEYVCISGKGEELLKQVKAFYDAHIKFLNTIQHLSLDYTLYQERGGNVSLKYDDKMIVSASGIQFNNINIHEGYCVCKQNIFECCSEIDYMQQIQSLKVFENLHIPSMETGFHLLLPNPAVIHTHPLYVNAILCSKEAPQIIAQLFKDIHYLWMDYVTPGYDLWKKMKTCQLPSVIFLKNHGLIVNEEILDDAFNLTEHINNVCKKWLKENIELFVDCNKYCDNLPLFPDAVVFPDATKTINIHLLHLMNSSGLTPDFLTPNQITQIINLNFEKYRKTLT